MYLDTYILYKLTIKNGSSSKRICLVYDRIKILIQYIKENSIKKVEHSLAGAVNKIPQRFYCFLIIVFVFSLGNSTDALLLVKTSETGISHSLIPLVFMLYNTVSVILAVPIGKLSDKIGHGKMIVIGFFLYSIIYFIFGNILRPSCTVFPCVS